MEEQPKVSRTQDNFDFYGPDSKPYAREKYRTPYETSNTSIEFKGGRNAQGEGSLDVSNTTNGTRKRRKPIVIMSIDISESQTEKLQAYENDDPGVLAQDFCKQYSLDMQLAEVIEQSLREQIEVYYTSKGRNRPQGPKEELITKENHQGKVEGAPQKPEYDLPRQSSPRGKVPLHDETDYYNDFRPNIPAGKQQAEEKDQLQHNTAKFRELNDERPQERTGATQIYESWATLIREKQMEQRSGRPQAPTKKEVPLAKEKEREKEKPAWATPREIDHNASLHAAHRLYVRGVNEMKRKEERSFQEQQRKEREEMEKATFHPSVSQARDDDFNYSRRVEDKLLSEGEKMREKREKARRLKEEIEMEACTFKPELSQETWRMVSRDQNNSIHDRLFEEASRNRLKREEFVRGMHKELCPFTPTTRAGPRREESQQELAQRLHNEAKEKDRRLMMARVRENTGFDPKTGQRLWQPKITKDNYYERAKRREEQELNRSRKASANATDRSSRQVQRAVTPTGRSRRQDDLHTPRGVTPENGHNDPNVRLLIKVFVDLDSDHDGFISAEKINLHSVRTEILSVLAELIIEIEERRLVLAFSDFQRTLAKMNLRERLLQVFFL
eukprot:TRINITY_DN4485_c0_g1_i1.p1 TRINITY_DN4485_c0_g1~~TRINITY_DN4485_c0_g1_i1.p1  ORF type:complete len:616 (+),score=179.08 TRINITY_DN4485_c0_g1_i1:80-1927(+)